MPFNKTSCSGQSIKKSMIGSNEILSQHCSDEERELFAQNMKCILYRKGEMIFYEHQPVQSVYFMNSGKVKLWKEGIHKEEQIIHFASKGDVLGYWGCLEDTEYTLSATALEDTDICFIDKDVFFKTRDTNPEMHFHLLQDYTRELKKIEAQLRNMAEMNVSEKTATALLILNETFSTQNNNASLGFDTSRQDIAALAGISVDRVSKQLTIFKDEGVITMEDRKISVVEKALKKIIAPYIILETA